MNWLQGEQSTYLKVENPLAAYLALLTIPSIKVYKSHLRRWGIRKNLKRQEALELATGQGSSSSAFWPDGRDDDYADRIRRHVSRSERKREQALQAWTPGGGRQAATPPRRLRGPDLMEKVESASYYLNIYLTDFNELRTWFWTGPSSGEQEAFSSLFIRGLGRLSRNEQPHQAFKEINLAYDYLKRLVEWDHPLVYLRLIVAISAFNQYPQSEICSYICRSLSEHVRKLSVIVHGAGHPLNNAWGDAIYYSSIEGPESFALAVPAQVLRRCRSVRSRIVKGFFNIADCVPSDARRLDEASLREAVSGLAPSRGGDLDLLVPTAQEARLAMAELLIGQGRCAEGLHFFSEAMAFQGEDRARRAGKTFWAAELEWRSGNGRGSIETLRSALEYADAEAAGETGDEAAAGKLRQEINEVLFRRRNLLFLEETSGRIPSCYP